MKDETREDKPRFILLVSREDCQYRHLRILRFKIQVGLLDKDPKGMARLRKHAERRECEHCRCLLHNNEVEQKASRYFGKPRGPELEPYLEVMYTDTGIIQKMPSWVQKRHVTLH